MLKNSNRKELIDELAEVINKIDLPHPVRVGIDGAGNAGKTTFADELVEPLEKLGRTVIRATIDGFHNPPNIRRRQGKYSPQGYLEDSYNYNALKRYLLDPLGPNGGLKYRESVYNFKINKPTNSTIKTATQNSILIFEGIFLFNQHLFTYWDYKLYLNASFENTMKRALIRDRELFGGEENVIKLYKRRYIPGQKMYLAKYNPIKKSDIVVNNNDFLNPTVMKISDHPNHKNLFHIRNSLSNNS
jgi:uridine kinase